MSRKQTGCVIEHVGSDGLQYHSIRVSAFGGRHFLALGCVPRLEADARLAEALLQIEAGTWQPPRNARRFGQEPDRFFDRRGPDECWPWTGHRNPVGYGKLAARWAHRTVYELLVGAVPVGHDLHHLCGVKHCVNPVHLRPLTRAEHARLHGEQKADKGTSAVESRRIHLKSSVS